jgi:hypothetical protein
MDELTHAEMFQGILTLLYLEHSDSETPQSTEQSVDSSNQHEQQNDKTRSYKPNKTNAVYVQEGHSNKL